MLKNGLPRKLWNVLLGKMRDCGKNLWGKDNKLLQVGRHKFNKENRSRLIKKNTFLKGVDV